MAAGLPNYDPSPESPPQPNPARTGEGFRHTLGAGGKSENCMSKNKIATLPIGPIRLDFQPPENLLQYKVENYARELRDGKSFPQSESAGMGKIIGWKTDSTALQPPNWWGFEKSKRRLSLVHLPIWKPISRNTSCRCVKSSKKKRPQVEDPLYHPSLALRKHVVGVGD